MSTRPAPLARAGVAVVVAVAALLSGYKLWLMWMSREPSWPNMVARVDIPSPADNSLQPAMFYAPPPSSAEAPRPLLVALHTWGAGFNQSDSIAYADWCIAHGWVFVHPHFRGANDQPAAMGSEWVVADILAAVEYAKQHAKVDPGRIYLIGESGGGYAALLMAGRAPQEWAGASVWVPPVDMQAFHDESKARGLRFAAHIAQACGGAPETGSAAAAECAKRSATTTLARARDVPIDLNAGIRDGHDGGGSVSIRHSLTAFNLLADPADRFSA
ncbi:MAG: prolyl oligopeptidase family serine peptidase, partial [Betaproteobacteria bacterium]